jgi:hypothetical protein
VQVDPRAAAVELEEHRRLAGASDAAVCFERAAARAFDLARPPLSRAVLAEVGADDHILLLVAHHVIADAAGMWALVADLAEEYERVRDPGAPERPLPVQYSEYAQRDARRMTAEYLEAATAYWTRTLDGCQFAHLPRGGGKGSTAEAYGRVSAHLDCSVVDAVRRAGEAEGASDYMVLLTTFMLAMSELMGAGDLAAPSVFTTRIGRRFGDVVGAMVTGVAIRSTVQPGDPSASLGAVRDACLEALRYYHVPRSVARTALLRSSRGRVRSGGASVRFQVVPAPPTPAWAGLDVTPDKSPARTYGADAELSVVNWPDAPALDVTYRADRVDGEVVERLCDAYARIVHSVWAPSPVGGSE